jgi:NADPH2:quinone reductase
MKAVLLRRPGTKDELVVSEVPEPKLPSPRHILVRLHAAGLNPVDYKLRQAGTFYPETLPAILGCDGAGTVEEVGADVTRFRPGDPVFFMNGGFGDEPGTYAEYTAVPEFAAALKPPALSMEEAAALPIVLITAWESLERAGTLPVGTPALIHAGSGGVGHIALQLARNRGMTVLTTVRGPEKEAFAITDGAHHVIDPDRSNFVEETRRLTGGRGAGFILDTVGGDVFCRSFEATRIYGHVATLLEKACDPAAIIVAKRMNLSVHFVLILSPALMGLESERIRQTRILEAGAHLCASGGLKVRIARTFPLDGVREAHAELEAGHTAGKIVLTIR